ncbi:GNAT family N-acetyltransferase [Litoribrevibacter euphylliae]|uniref:GNAT family N-acetyltransferase n=1 Tax=Litoribrevibacter euphylliae TaxID=1834034 RepID=A0ABV7HDE3_9GAMM
MELAPYSVQHSVEIQNLYEKTFSDSEGESEGTAIRDLVACLMSDTATQDLFGFVAYKADKVIGCIFFSRLEFDDPVEAFLLSPVAVDTKFQGQGVGQALINFGLEQLKKNEVRLVFTYGDPNYYSKVGFQQISEDIAKAPFKLSQPHGWLCQSLDGSDLAALAGNARCGTARCVAAFNVPELW